MSQILYIPLFTDVDSDFYIFYYLTVRKQFTYLLFVYFILVLLHYYLLVLEYFTAL